MSLRRSSRKRKTYVDPKTLIDDVNDIDESDPYHPDPNEDPDYDHEDDLVDLDDDDDVVDADAVHRAGLRRRAKKGKKSVESKGGGIGIHVHSPTRDSLKRADPTRADSTRADSTRADPTRADPARTDPTRADGLDLTVVTIESAKSARAKCRLCMEKIEKGEFRIGMRAWIMGRNAITWQHPECFFDTAEITRDTTGRGKCKVSKERFSKGEARMTFRSHTTKANVKLVYLADCLRCVFQTLPKDRAESIDPSEMDGYDNLSDKEKDIITNEFRTAKGGDSKREDFSGDSNKKKKSGEHSSREKKSGEQDDNAPQPVSGKGSNLSGAVAWKWGGKTCYGNLLQSKETNSHCYARTKTGKIKTLVKGKSHWWMMAA
ncbi:hypothetical protein AAMO2058_001265000 [Amorphochlora amoebiformis]